LVTNVSPNTVNRVICDCDDCQAFLHQLDRADLLDAQGGSDIIQIAPASLSFVAGRERIVGLRLTPRGLLQMVCKLLQDAPWQHARSGYSIGGGPGTGIQVETQKPDDLCGPPIGRIFGKYAIDGVPERSTRLNPWLVARVMRMVLGWRMGGQTWPHPLFDRAGRAPNFPVTTLSPQERKALRPRCGPNPSALSTDSRARQTAPRSDGTLPFAPLAEAADAADLCPRLGRSQAR